VAATLVAFAPALTAGFVTWDDNRNFTENPFYRGLGWDQLHWMWTTALTGHYIPLSWMTLGLDYLLWGMDARGYHLTNLLLHAGASVALYFAVARLVARARPNADSPLVRMVAVASALLFAIHPLRVESVAWVTERRDVLSLLLMLGSLLAYLRFVDTGSRRAWAGSLALFAAALLSKATVVTLPLVLVILEWYPLRRLSKTSLRAPEGRRVLAGLAPFFALSAATGVLSLLVLNPPAQLDLAGKIAVSAFGVRFYLAKWLWPAGLSPLYPLPRHLDPLAPTFVVSYALAALAIAVAFVASRRHRGLAAIIAATTVMMLPLIGLVQNGPQIAADRYTYHAAAALSVLPALLLFRWHSRGALALAAGVLAVLGVLTWRQTLVWHDSEALWTRVLEVDGTSSLGQIGLGNVRIEQQRYAEALDHYQRGVALDPDYAEGQNNLASLLARSGRLSEAIPHYERATRLNPDYAEAWSSWATALATSGKTDEAIARLRDAIARDSTMPGIHLTWGNILAHMGQRAEAQSQYAEELRVHPDNADARLAWGIVLAQAGQFAQAVAQFDEALRIDPGLAAAREYRAQVVQRIK
jgi:tetratricopeptide (TPR) repeat protein